MKQFIISVSIFEADKRYSHLKGVFTIFFAWLLISCNAQTPQNKTTATTKTKALNMQEGKDYIILKRYRTVDNQGFSQPVEAFSFMLPANWQVSSGVQWNATNKCIPEMVQANISAKSPDGNFELLLLPVTQFDWSDDRVYLDAMQRGFNRQSCHIAQPLDAAGYIRNAVAPNMNARVKSAGVIAALQKQMDAGANEMTMQARQGGNGAYNHRGSAAEGVLEFADGREGLAFCTLMQTIVTMAGIQGNMANIYQCYVSMRVVLKYKKGDEAMARKIMSTFFSSSKINPTWGVALQNFFMAITKNAQDQTWKQIQEVREVQQQMGNNIIRSWEAKNRTTNMGVQANNNDEFGKYLRGVDNWTDANGNKVELTSGYSNAWSRNDGSYLLSNNPTFDPNVELGGTQSWGRMNQ